jgi:hypothetical protein
VNIGEMVERLVAAGCDPVVAASVVAEVFTAGVLSADYRGQTDETAERRRTKDRDRKREKRAAARNLSAESADCLRIPQTEEKALTLSSLPYLPSLEVKKERKKVRARKQELSADFQPNENHFAAAAKLGIPRQAVFEKCEDMRLWAKSSGAVKADWDATLHGFLRRDASKLSTNGQNHAKPSSRSSVVDAARRFAEQFESQSGSDFATDSGPVLRVQKG